MKIIIRRINIKIGILIYFFLLTKRYWYSRQNHRVFPLKLDQYDNPYSKGDVKYCILEKFRGV
jgi:hypothetical protein